MACLLSANETSGVKKLLLPWVLLLPFQVVEAEPTAASVCESRDLTFDSKEITCSIPASPGKSLPRLVVKFSGGHDDTMASMAVQVNGEPFTCGAGSKLRLMGEDGDVS